MAVAMVLAAPFCLPAGTANGLWRNAQIEVAVGEDGALTGVGVLSLSGDRALLGRALGADVAHRHRAWAEWLRNSFEGYRIESFVLDESAAQEQTVLRWQMKIERVVEGSDRVEVMVALPVSPAIAPTKVAADRVLPRQLPFVARDELEMTVTWSGRWAPDRLPVGLDLANDAGHLNARRVLDSTARRLVYRRTLTLAEPEDPAAALGPERDLLAAMRNIDVQTLVLVRRASGK